MLDQALEVLYDVETRRQATFDMVGLMKDLPDLELRKIAEGTPVAELYGRLDKRASGEKTASGDECFLDRFKGSPLIDQAIALEQEELQAEMLDMQKRQERRAANQNEDSLYDAKDKIRIRKRLLELQLVKEQSGAAQPGAPGSPPGEPAQGAGAPGDVPAEGVQDSSQGLGGGVAKMAGARLEELRRAGDLAGRLMTKSALNLGALGQSLGGAAKGLGSAVAGWAAKNPLQAATTAGGALMGAQKGGLSGAVGGGLMGNMAGRGIGALGKNMGAGQSLGQAAGNVAMGGIQRGVGLLNG